MSDISRISDHGDEQGHCKGCKWWQAEPDAVAVEGAVIGLCLHGELTHFSLQVSGDSGCNRFAHAEIAELAGVH